MDGRRATSRVIGIKSGFVSQLAAGARLGREGRRGGICLAKERAACWTRLTTARGAGIWLAEGEGA